ncbi:uncharacterized protein N7484_009558 [Penicillium longicatenatum]|uniref:uncharacterized protein n=1 Tax=Penicillium longicatenatum TaxID=1561947 RepID=UPI00254906A4|nr:uncharacterized protein N7484_009558 [Penicillium longicatenatum]KAJ5636245.1 hypothetical protein N7484_009558 [Penicillium longicatenatum]
MKVFAKMALVACLSASVSALPTPDASGNSISKIARSEDVTGGAASFGSGPWKKRGEDAVQGNTPEWKKRGEDAVDGNTPEWKK